MIADLQIIPGLPQYQAGSNGNIYRIYHNGKIKQMAQCLDRYGYNIVRIQRNGHQRFWKVHRLICAAFHGPCPKNMMTRHLDGNKSNNSPDNLCWGTAQDNSDDKRKHGTMCEKEKSGRAKLKQSDINNIRSRYANGEIQQVIAKDFKISQSHVSEIILWKSWQ